MNKTVIYVCFAFLLGLVVGAFVMLVAFPFLFPPAPMHEMVTNIEQKTLAAGGTFIHPDPSDRLHWGRGSVSIYRQDAEHEIFLGSDFEVGPGPYYFIYMSAAEQVTSNAEFEAADRIRVGQLKSFRGSQVYQLKGGFDPASSRTVVVWCEAFGQLITSARLR
ncbi:MAG: DM13 domain-containing protein [Thiotrichales bacterium]|nr:DM13 domain-containing protein [Thiotrichales bacterium]